MAHSHTEGFAGALSSPRVHFPYFHAVPPREEGSFRRYIEALQIDHTFISYTDGVERVLRGPIDKPYVALSFDDGFLSNVRAAEILEDYGISGCFFIPPGFIETSLSVAEAMDHFGFSAGIDEPAMSWADLERMKSAGHEIGNHTFAHPTISSMAPQQAVDEINRAAERIRSVLGSCRHFAWPRGRFFHFTDAAARAVFDAGHLSCASAERGAHVQIHGHDPRSLCLRRDHQMTSWPTRHNRHFLARSSEQRIDCVERLARGWNVGSCGLPRLVRRECREDDQVLSTGGPPGDRSRPGPSTASAVAFWWGVWWPGKSGHERTWATYWLRCSWLLTDRRKTSVHGRSATPVP